MLSAAALATALALAQLGGPGPLVVAVDADDDDRSGAPDLADRRPRSLQVAALGPARGPVRAPGFARLVVDGEAVGATWDGKRPVKALGLQALAPGRGALSIAGAERAVVAVGLRAIDGAGREVDLATSHASLERSLPSRAPAREDAAALVVVAPRGDLPARLRVRSFTEGALRLGEVELPLSAGPCPEALRVPPEAGLACASSPALRVAIDELDRAHPLVSARSVVGALGGALEVRARIAGVDVTLARMRVGGPRDSPVGPIQRLRLRLRTTVVIPGPGLPDDAAARGAASLAGIELSRAARLWGQCGVGIRDDAVRVVPAPGPHLLAVGCELGLRASGGRVALRVDGREVRAKIARGASPAEAARVLAAAIEASGAKVRLTPLARVGPAALPGVDLSVRTRAGALAAVEPVPGAFAAPGALTDDATLGLCIGRVDLSDGLTHFVDVDSIAGSLEERALLEAIDDGDPTTAELVLVPGFAGGARIGESFIGADGGALRGFVLVDRGGARAEGLSSTLAHELGHVLLEEPGHPDDFGGDTSTRLMDADAASGTLFGPRRLTHAECARAVREHGPDAPVPMLEAWPLAPLSLQEVGPP